MSNLRIQQHFNVKTVGKDKVDVDVAILEELVVQL